MKYFYTFAIILSIFFASWFVLHNTVYFYGDLARDFLLFEEIVLTKKPILIGPRTSMQGVFHGPLWLYLNIPAFIIGKGNPVVVAWFWVLLVAASIGCMYFVTKKILSKKEALPITALYALAIASSAPYLYNPFGAVFFSPLFFLFFIRYMHNQKNIDLLISLFCVGVSIQFEMVWGVPILFLASIVFLFKIIKSKKYNHLFSFGILSIPLSTFILFDLRHQFIQFHSIIRYVVGKPGDVRKKIDIIELLVTRAKDMALSMSGYFSNGSLITSGILTGLSILLIFIFYKKKLHKKYFSVSYFLYFYIGFWILTLPIKGMIYDYYYWAFLPLFCIAVGTMGGAVLKKYVYGVYILSVLFLTLINISIIYKQDTTFFKTSTALWSFYKSQASTIYKDAKGDFGWYVYTADQYAYSFKYAMSYVQQQFPNNKSYKFEKKPLTYLMIYPSDNQYTNETGWKSGGVRIEKKPHSILKFMGNSYAEKYNLTKEEQAVQSDSTLLQDLTFR